MATPSAAQVLPALVVEKIALLLSPPTRSWPHLHGQHPLVDFPPLVQLMGVCRAWRQSVLPLVYRTVVLGLARDDVRHYGKSLKTLQQAVEAGCQDYVRRVSIHVESINPALAWDSQSVGSAAFLRSCCPLPAVHSVSFGLNTHALSADGRPVSTEDKERMLLCAADDLGAVVCAASQAMPNVRCVNISSWLALSAAPDAESYVGRLIGSAYSIVSARVLQLALAGEAVVGLLPASLPTGCLKSIVIAGVKQLGPGAELIRRHAETLERLAVSGVTAADAASLFFVDDDSSQIIVYPRLGHLDIDCNDGPQRSSPAQPTANPFPAIKDLRAKGHLPFSAATVLHWCRERLHTLGISLYRNSVDSLQGGAAAAADAIFTRLDRIGVHLENDLADLAGGAEAQLSSLLKLCPFARSVSIRDLGWTPLCKDYAAVQFPRNMQHLDLGATRLTIDQAMAALCSCPCLHTASFGLEDHTMRGGHWTPATPSSMQYRKMYNGRTSSVRRLVLTSTGNQNKCIPYDTMVLLTDLLPSVVCVVAVNGSTLPEEFQDNVRRVLNGPEYKDGALLQRVAFFLQWF